MPGCRTPTGNHGQQVLVVSAVASHQSQVVVSRAVIEEEVAELADAFPTIGAPAPSPMG